MQYHCCVVDWQCRAQALTNRACFGGDSDRIGSETASPVLVSGCVVNRACFALDTDRNGYETALPVLVSRYVGNGGCLEGDGDWIDN